MISKSSETPCPRTAIIQSNHHQGINWQLDGYRHQSTFTSPLAQPLQSGHDKEDAWRLRISDPPLLCVCAAGLEEEENQRSWRSAVAEQPPDPGTRLVYSTKVALGPTHSGCWTA